MMYCTVLYCTVHYCSLITYNTTLSWYYAPYLEQYGHCPPSDVFTMCATTSVNSHPTIAWCHPPLHSTKFVLFTDSITETGESPFAQTF